MADFLIVSQAARILGVSPKTITNAFYLRQLDDAACPILVGRRMIPRDYLPKIEAVLREAGKLPAAEEGK